MDQFDDYVDQYETLIKNQVHIFDRDLNYFAQYKVDIIKRKIDFEPKRFVDFGCGIGSSLPYIENNFRNTEVVGVDISSESLLVAKKRVKRTTLFSTACWYDSDDLADVVFMSNVIHHIPLQERSFVYTKIFNKLVVGGCLIVFEHNPYNPLTRYFVNTCAFDKHAVLIQKHQMIRDLKKIGFNTLKSGYSLFFPNFMRYFRKYEDNLAWLPIGGQFYTFSYKNSNNS